MSDGVPVKGGPFDGATIPKDGQFRWVSTDGGHAAPGPGRALYRYVSGGYDNGIRFERHYLYVGAATRWCGACNATTGRRTDDPPGRCGACGGPTQPSYELKEST